MAIARYGGFSRVALIFLAAARQMSAACSVPTTSAACHTGSRSTAARNTALATLTLALMLMWRGNSRARIPVTARETISHQSGPPSARRSTLTAATVIAAAPTTRRNSSERLRGVMRSADRECELEVNRRAAPAVFDRVHRPCSEQAAGGHVGGPEVEEQARQHGDLDVDRRVRPAEGVVDTRRCIAAQREADLERRRRPDALVDGDHVPAWRDDQHQRVPVAVRRPGRGAGRRRQKNPGRQRGGDNHPLPLVLPPDAG